VFSKPIYREYIFIGWIVPENIYSKSILLKKTVWQMMTDIAEAKKDMKAIFIVGADPRVRLGQPHRVTPTARD
jgi:hypothetical protein